MPRSLVSATFLCLLVLSAGCASTRPFTHVDREVHAAGLADLQFYLSHDTRISRRLQSRIVSVTPGHAIRSYAREEVIEIIIRKSMPGVLVGVEGDTLLVSFEPPVAGRERYFRFVPVKSTYYLDTRRGGRRPAYDVVTYADESFRLGRFGRKWSAFSPDFSFYPEEKPFLLIRIESIKKLDKMRRELPGRRVSRR